MQGKTREQKNAEELGSLFEQHRRQRSRFIQGDAEERRLKESRELRPLPQSPIPPPRKI